MIEVRFQRGIHLPEADLWLDPWDAKPRAFVSHAHADHFARHESVLCSDVTAALLKNRFRLAENRTDPVSFHVPILRDGFRIRLLPAGHIPGSAMLHITRMEDNSSLLYTGDFKTRRSRITEGVNFLAADTLILETTFGLPCYEFPNPMETEAEILRFIDDCFTDGETPVLLGYSLGKAQEALALLEENGIPAVLHPAVAAMTKACRDAGVPGLPEPVEFDGHAPAGHVVIAPPNAMRSAILKGLKSKRTAMLSGWALQPGAKYRYRVDAMIPFSDHADHSGLMECVQRVRPQRVFTVHGFAREFAAELRTRKIDAWCAEGGDQLELPIQRPTAHRVSQSRGAWHKRVLCPLADFSDLCRLVEETGSRVSKTTFLTSYLSGLENDDDLRTAVLWLTGESMPRPSGKHSPLLNSSMLQQALARMPGAREQRYREIHLEQKDIIRSTRIFLQDLQLQPDLMDLAGTAEFVLRFRSNTHSMDRIEQLAARLATLHPAEGETLVKLLTGDLRLGIDLPLIEEALTAAFNAPPDEIHHAVRITGNHGEVAVLARHGRLADASPSPPSEAAIPPPAESASTGELPFSAPDTGGLTKI